MKKLIPFAFFLSMAISINAQDVGIRFMDATWEQVMAEAKKQEKLIFVDAYTTWCGPCKVMAQNVFTQKEVGDFYNQYFINYKLDMEKGEGLDFAKTYKVKAYPTFLFIDGDGNLVHQSLGSRPVQSFIELGEAAHDPDRQVGALMRRFESGDRQPDFLKQYVQAVKNSRVGDPEVALNEYLATQEDRFTPENAAFILEMASTSPDSEHYRFVKENREAMYEAVGENPVDEFLKTGILYQFRLKRNPSEKEVADAFREVFTVEKADRFAAEFNLRQLMFSKKTEDQQRFLKAAIIYMEQYPQASWEMLNSLAWRFYELTDDEDLLRIAKEWALQSVAQHSAYHNNDTVAALYLKLKEKDAARRYALAAIEIAKQTGENYEETQKLLEEIESSSRQ
jgi:thioredoxin-related protein